jgi:transcriptional regulator with XRE-family HTH domain
MELAVMKPKKKPRKRPTIAPEGNLGERLAELRKEREMSQRELAKLVGITQAAYQRLETGHAEPRLSTLRGLAASLGITVGALIGEHGS